MDEFDWGVGYYQRTYSLKQKDGRFAWIYDDGAERFLGVDFPTHEEAAKYHDERYGKTFVKFEKI